MKKFKLNMCHKPTNDRYTKKTRTRKIYHMDEYENITQISSKYSEAME